MTPSDTIDPTRRLALFDLDNTLLTGDTEVLWGEFLVLRGQAGAGFAERNAEMERRYQAGLADPGEFCAFYASTLADKAAAEWQPLREAFMAEVIRQRIPTAALALVAQYRARGDTLVLTSASSRFLVQPTAAELGFAHLIATELGTTADGRFTGATEGTLNMREGKVARLQAWLDSHGIAAGDVLPRASFHSDSINDLPLLMAVGQPVAVDPDARLEAEALARGWPVLRLPRDQL
jgi:HAD superfamily hydrolase (TIGR01490 family)